MKILLINPPNEFESPTMPLGLASIAAYLKMNRIENISAIDAWVEKMDLPALENSIAQSQADIVGIYMISPCYDAAKTVVEAARRTLPKSIIVAGGSHPSALPRQTLQEIPQLDICVIGEGEITMYELVRAVENNSPFSEVNGIAFRNENKEIIVTNPRAMIKNLDILPFPDRDLFQVHKYGNPPPPLGRKKPFLTIMTSRGCPFHCAFCSKDVYQDSYRARSPKKVCDEIAELIDRYRAQEIEFYDDDFTMNMQRAEEICDEIIRRDIKIRWSCLTRTDLVNEKLLRKMKMAGCWNIAYGVESGDQKILNTIAKGISVEQIISAFKMTKKAGIATSCLLLFGLPGETEETVKATFALTKKLKPDFIGSGILIVYPGSRFFKAIQEGKYTGRLRVLKKNDEVRGTFFGKGNFIVFEENMTFEELKKIIRKSWKSFYLRPCYILQRLTSIRSFSDVKYYFTALVKVLKTVKG